MKFKLVDFHLDYFSKSTYVGQLTTAAIRRLWDRIDLSKRPLTEFTVTKSANQITCFFSCQNYVWMLADLSFENYKDRTTAQSCR